MRYTHHSRRTTQTPPTCPHPLQHTLLNPKLSTNNTPPSPKQHPDPPSTLHPPHPNSEAEAFHNFIRVDAQEKAGQARHLRALEDQLLEQTLLVERLVNMSTQQAELLRQ